MKVYLCRWPNGDVSLVSGTNKLAIDDVLDEVGNPGSAVLIPIKHAVAVHFRLKEKIERSFTIRDCLELEGINERLFSDVCDTYPILDKVLDKEGATAEEIALAVEQELNRVENVAVVQRTTHKRRTLADHHNESAKAIASKKK